MEPKNCIVIIDGVEGLGPPKLATGFDILGARFPALMTKAEAQELCQKIHPDHHPRVYQEIPCSTTD